MHFLSILAAFGRLLEHFRSQNAIKNRVKFWMRFWRSKRGAPSKSGGRFGGMRGGIGEDYGGVRETISAENRGRDQRRRSGILGCVLARRPRWGGGSLRAFRRAGVIFDAVSRKLSNASLQRERQQSSQVVGRQVLPSSCVDFWFYR